MEPFNFNELPEVVRLLFEKVESIEQIILSLKPAESGTEDLLNVVEAAAFLKISEASLYSKVSRKEIPFSKPGKRLYFSRNELQEVYARKDDNLFINGVINTDPSGKDKPTIIFLHKNEAHKGSFKAAVQGHIAETFAFWKEEEAQIAVSIHSKLIVIDPFSENPVVMTGSHNMGEKASNSNDDNLNTITGNPDIAIAYALGIFSIYKHYCWRFYRSKGGEPKWNGLQKTPDWQKYYVDGDGQKLVDFWL
jgi:excisionase family DNA binding protein